MIRYGQIIAKLRKERGMTQKELGKRLNVSFQAISKWENDLSQPDLESLHALAQVFDIPFVDFIQLFQEETSPQEQKKEPLKKDKLLFNLSPFWSPRF